MAQTKSGGCEMQTVEQAIKAKLMEWGMWEHMADEVVEMVKTDDVSGTMFGRWNDDISEYGPDWNNLFAVLLLSAKRNGLEYIKEHKPKAWFRPMFDDEMMAEVEKEMGV